MIKNATVCLLNDSFPPQIDGVANTILNYANHLERFGSHPIVITPAYPHADDSSYPYPVLRYPSVNFRRMEGYVAGLPFSPEVASRVSEQEVSLIHSHCPVISTFMARQMRQIVNAPIVLTYHTKFDVDIENIIKNKVLQTACKKTLLANISAADEVWAVSKGAGENMRSLGYEGDYIVMPNGVDLPRGRMSEDEIASVTSRYGLPQQLPVYLFVGRMMWYKGIQIIIDALSQLKANGRDFRMVFIGDGDDRTEIEDYAAICGLRENCVFTGAIRDRKSLRAWYCRADLFLFPSTYDTNGLVVREAAACSLASVLIKGSCAAEGVSDGRNGFLIEENAEALCGRLAELYPKKEKVKEAGRAAAQDIYISWEDSVSAAMCRYETVIERYKSGGCARSLKPMEGVMKINGELMDTLGKLTKLKRTIERL